MTIFLQTLPFLLDGLLTTLFVSGSVVLIAIILGIPAGCALVFGPFWARVPLRL